MSTDFSLILLRIAIPDLLDGIPHGIAITDRELRVVALNSHLAQTTGYPFADVKGVYIDAVIRSNIAHLNRIATGIIETGTRQQFEGDIIDRNRHRLPVQFTLAPLLDKDGRTVGLIVVIDELVAGLIENDHPAPLAEADEFIACSEVMTELLERLPLIARTEAAVLLTGETGTGKSSIAKIIHRHSSRCRQPFLQINCAALPEPLLETELFGHARGAFPGALRDRPGILRQAHGGTLLLTEIGELPFTLQIKLLSVLDNHEFTPVGGERKVAADIRIIATTRHNLRDLAASGAFREDLFYRLNVLHLHLPPLRARQADLPPLVRHFLRTLTGHRADKEPVLSAEAMDLLTSHPFPGNIRELRNIVEYCVRNCPDQNIGREHLPEHLLSGTREDIPAPGQRNWLAVERDLIVSTLAQTGGNRSKTAEILGWGRTTLWRKLRQHGLVPARSPISGQRIRS